MITASHELRTPLTAVQGYLELLEHYQEMISPVEFQEFVQKAARSCDELVLLLNNIMDAGRLEIEAGLRPVPMVRIALLQLVESVINLLTPLLVQEDREVRIHIPPHLCVQADTTYLRQVLLNLCNNALKYSPAGTPLEIAAQLSPSQNGQVVLQIKDYGKGIKQTDQQRLFQRFVRLESDMNSVIRGSGLGLYISRRLLEAMSGKIWVNSTGQPGQGSAFSIQIPQA
jgi:signal transduction histidine kinase